MNLNIRSLKDNLNPALKKVELEVDIFPYQRKMKTQGHFLFKNETSSVIQTLFVHYPVQFAQEFSMEWSRSVALSEKNEDMSLSIYKLEKPLNPGEEPVTGISSCHILSGFST